MARRVHLFVPCVASALAPEIGAAAETCLRAAGCDVVRPLRGPACCGQAFSNSGLPRKAAPLARRFVRAFAEAEHVVVPSGSCVATVRERYGDLLRGPDLAAWESLRDRCRELCDFLVRECGIGAWSGRLPALVALHWSCHLPRDASARDAVHGLLRGIDGLEVLPPPEVPLPDECCGFGGVFWTARRDASAAIGARRVDALTRAAPDLIAALEPGCVMQLRHSAPPVPVAHVAEVLASAVGCGSIPAVPCAAPPPATPAASPVLRATDHSARVRAAALSSIDWPAAREAAISARRRALDDHPALLAELRGRLESRGVRVHLAPTGKDACAYVADLARRHGARLLAKAKSMTGEEIGLAAALESAGRRVVETDLGEFIVQLRGEPPSHVTGPAIHLSRAQIADLFAERLGMPRSEDPDAIVGFAREHLRRDFLAADMGFVGVNAAVAATGDLLTVTNEGNGRLCSALPRVLVALAGVEKVVASPDDAASILRVLARSATGQHASAYVSSLRGPAAPGEPFGPSEVHLVLLDGGRSAIARDPDVAGILRCVRCGACMNACPVYRTIGGHAYGTTYPGPMGIVWTAGLRGIRAAAVQAYHCTLCGECERVCPVGIELPGMILALRARAPKGPAKRAAMAGAGFALRSPGRLAAVSRMAAVTARVAPGLYARVARTAGWTHPLPPPIPVAVAVAVDRRVGVPEVGIGPRPGRREACRPGDAALTPDMFAAAGCEVVASIGEIGLRPGTALVDRTADEAGVAATLRAAGWTVLRSDDPGLDRAAAASATLGVTGCLALVEETGSVLLGHGPGEDRVASLLPEVHAVLTAGAPRVATLKEALAIRDRAGTPAATLVTGPSRTADIEKVLVLGMHGPRRLVLVA